jgi:hypothetical protein
MRLPACPILLLTLAAGLGVGARHLAEEYKSGKVWPVPKTVDPGPLGGPPADAIVLFDGKDLSQWEGGENWLVEGSVATVGKGGITSKQFFGDCQLHVEWAAPAEVKGKGQGRGNSGIYLMSRYEIQVLDSYDNETYPDGQCAALYKQSPPLVNACRKPGEWQTFDIVFRRPHFDAEGRLTRPGRITVLHNGVLVQDHVEIQGSTAWDQAPAYAAHPEKLPLFIQDHGNPVRFRNLWIRELEPGA